MDAEIIEALNLSKGDIYLARERAPHLNEPHGDLLWARGTNTSIFLSCYSTNDGWKLMSKGSQLQNGFVPMMETVDIGINDPFGTNYVYISGVDRFNIYLAGSYAIKTYNAQPVDETKLKIDVLELFDPEYKGDCRPIPIAYAFLRYRQYTGLETLDLGDFRDTKCYKNARAYVTEMSEYIVKAIRILSAKFDVYRARANELKVLHDKKGYLKLQNDASKPYNLTREAFSTRGDFYAQHLEGAQEDKKQWLRQGVFQLIDYKLFSYAFAIAMFASDDLVFRGLKDSLVQELEKGLSRLAFQQRFLELAIDTRKRPEFVLTESDKDILRRPFPILVASRKRRPIRFSGIQVDMVDSIEIGDNGVDVIYTREEDQDALRTLLRERGLDIEVRVDNSIF